MTDALDTNHDTAFANPMPDAVYDELKRRAANVKAEDALTVDEARVLFRSMRDKHQGAWPSETEAKAALEKRRERRRQERTSVQSLETADALDYAADAI